MFLALFVVVIFVLGMIALYWNEQCKPEELNRQEPHQTKAKPRSS
jgi:hypothetical protein